MSKLYFRYGAMGCGKTMQLLQVAFNYEERGQKVLILKPAIDTKADKSIKTRIGPERETDFCFDQETNLYDYIEKNSEDLACVLVDESQFMAPEQADQLNRVAYELNIPVMTYGLRLNFRQNDKGFEGATRLLQIADDIEELKTICECGRKATRNARFLNNEIIVTGPDVLIDGTSKVEYRALCAKCLNRYLKETK